MPKHWNSHHTPGRFRCSSQLLASVWTSTTACRHLENEPADVCSLSLLSPSLSYAFQINRKKDKNKLFFRALLSGLVAKVLTVNATVFLFIIY